LFVDGIFSKSHPKNTWSACYCVYFLSVSVFIFYQPDNSLPMCFLKGAESFLHQKKELKASCINKE